MRQQAATLDRAMAAALANSAIQPRIGMACDQNFTRLQAFGAAGRGSPGRARGTVPAQRRSRSAWRSPVSAGLAARAKDGEGRARDGDALGGSLLCRAAAIFRRRRKAARPAKSGLTPNPSMAPHFRNRQEEDVARRLDQT